MREEAMAASLLCVHSQLVHKLQPARESCRERGDVVLVFEQDRAIAERVEKQRLTVNALIVTI
jgi:predicted nicotinamide N-methyase